MKPTKLQRLIRYWRIRLGQEWRENGEVVALLLSLMWLYLFWFGMLEAGR